MAPSAWVYIITNTRHSVIYVGSTNDLPTRLGEHRTKQNPRSFTARYNMHKLIYHEEFDGIERAMYIKGKTRNWKEELIKNFNPDWVDLTNNVMQRYR